MVTFWCAFGALLFDTYHVSTSCPTTHRIEDMVAYSLESGPVAFKKRKDLVCLSQDSASSSAIGGCEEGR